MRRPLWTAAALAFFAAGCSSPDFRDWKYADAEKQPRQPLSPAAPTESFPRIELPPSLKADFPDDPWASAQPAAGTVVPGPKPREEPAAAESPAPPGQPPQRSREPNPEPVLGADGWHHLRDRNGQDWVHTNPAWLKEWVNRVNHREDRPR